MKKFLLLAILLLNLLVEVNAQNYSSETYGSNTTWNSDLTELWSRAQASDADIYTEVYDADSYKLNDYSQYGNYSQEVVYPDGTHLYYNYDYDGSMTYSNGDTSSKSESNGSVSVGYSLTRVDGKYLTDNVWFQMIPYVASPGVTMATTIPAYYPFFQALLNECVACAPATMADIMGAGGLYSDYGDYKSTYWKIYNYARSQKIDLDEVSFNCDPKGYYYIIRDIGGVPVDMINTGDVQSYINKGCAVLGVLESYSNSVIASPDVHHMVTIVGYDDKYYYCIDPQYISPRAYPQSAFNPKFYYGYSKEI